MTWQCMDWFLNFKRDIFTKYSRGISSVQDWTGTSSFVYRFIDSKSINLGILISILWCLLIMAKKSIATLLFGPNPLIKKWEILPIKKLFFKLFFLVRNKEWLIERREERYLTFCFICLLILFYRFTVSTIFCGWIATWNEKGCYFFNRLFQPTLLLGPTRLLKFLKFSKQPSYFGHPLIYYVPKRI